MEIPDAVSPFLQNYDAVLLENHGALTYGDSLLGAYHKMEAVEFYAQLLFIARQAGGPKELPEEEVRKLCNMRANYGLTGRHPGEAIVKHKKYGKEESGKSMVLEITKRIMEEMHLK